MKLALVVACLSCLFLSLDGFQRGLLGKARAVNKLQLSLNDKPEIDLTKKMKKFFTASIASILIAASPFTSSAAQAGWFGPSEVEKQINDLCACQKQVTILHQQLTPTVLRNSIGVEMPMQLLKGGVEDSAFVQTTLDTVLKPCQAKMQSLTPQLTQLDEETQKKITNLPLLMKGHLLELQQAVNSLKASEQEKEVAEVEETLNDYLTAVNNKYPVSFYQGKDKQYLSDKEYYGPFGCEFWGKVRLEGSKTCVTPEEAAEIANTPVAVVDPLQKFSKVNTPLIQVRPPTNIETSSESSTLPSSSSE